MWTPNLQNSSMPRLPRYGSGIAPSGDINSSNLAYMQGGIASDPTAGVTADLLNPEWGPAVYDTEKRGAELAVAGGYRGSPLASYQTARMRASDIERRAALANSLLSGAASRVPNPANQENLLQLQQQDRQFNDRQALDRERLQFERDEADRRYQQQRNTGYRPLPQYMQNYREITPWGPGQSGPTGTTERYRY